MIPASNQLELTLFGPGYGESAVIHVGSGDWLVVDSCLDPSSKVPAPLKYLSELGVDVSTAVKVVCISHWHDDHVRGIADVVEAATSADCFCSVAVRGDEARAAFARGTLLEQRGDRSSVKELLKVFRILQGRNVAATTAPFGVPSYAIAGTRVFQRLATATTDDAEVFALSPSSSAFATALGNLLPKHGEAVLGSVAQLPNDTALALHVRLGNRSVLLGSDLETGKDVARGWHAVVVDRARPVLRSGVYKVAHHGAVSAEFEGIWTELLDPIPLGMLTPFVRGRTVLPTSTDVERLTHRCGAQGVWITTDPRGGRQPRYETAVERTVREIGGTLRERPDRVGFLRMRWDGDGAQIQPFGGARRL